MMKEIEGVRYLYHVIKDILRKAEGSLLAPESGPIGEHLVAFIMIWAMIRTPQTERYSDPKTVQHFLRSLLSRTLFSTLASRPELQKIMNSFVCCTSTVKMNTKYTQSKVLEAFERRVL